MDKRKLEDMRASYDRVAEEYARHIYDELNHKPIDRQLLDRFAASVTGPVCDLGCGPGQIAQYLHARGVDVIGVDLSEAMIEQARRLNPGIEFKQGNMLALDVEEEEWAGIASFYSIIHIERAEVALGLKEMNRVLQPAGLLLIAFHLGNETIHRDEWWGKVVSLDTYFFQRSEMEDNLKRAGFIVEEVVERPPYEDVEYPSHRAYIFARKPG
jgi:SAM-dependent methyltransferase